MTRHSDSFIVTVDDTGENHVIDRMELEKYSFKAEVDAAMLLIGGDAIYQHSLWTSSQSGASFAYIMKWKTGTLSGAGKGNNGFPRPFAPLNI